jgi:prolyl oligopeptidase
MSASDDHVSDDLYQWLEDVESDESMDWVRARNELTVDRYAKSPDFEALKQKLETVLTSNDRIPRVRKRGRYFYNFWQDAKNPRGVFRRTTWDEYSKEEPNWEVVIDLDALSHAEAVNWSYGGVDFLQPDYERCLVHLSRGGGDACEVREFDLVSKSFIAGGFFHYETKGSLEWIDKDRVFVFVDFGGDSLTNSGYPRIVKEWRRGTPVSSAKQVFSARREDVGARATRSSFRGFNRDLIMVRPSFFAADYYLRDEDGELVKIPIPSRADIMFFGEYLIVMLRDSWSVNGKDYKPGAVISCVLSDIMKGKLDFIDLFAPQANSAVHSFGRTKDFVYLHITVDLRNYVWTFKPSGLGWEKQIAQNIPEIGSIEIQALDEDNSNDVFLLTEDFLRPTTMMLGGLSSSFNVVKKLKDQFDASAHVTSQYFATSDDGTKIPYFVTRSAQAATAPSPTLLYGYGGFKVSLLPAYIAATGCGWLEQGGVYVVANIRGGGEYGPDWHKASLREKRHRCYEDFAAVARDLVERNISTCRQLGILGGSNGGLLVGNMLMAYPDLFAAAVCKVPLLDMKRYHKLLAGASWMEEFGDPDNPSDWTFLKTFSPYHLVAKGKRYPATLFTTSTRDDRVHPGHARKMMAKMLELDQDVWFYENLEGGHGGSATPKQTAFMQALIYQFLRERLFKSEI